MQFDQYSRLTIVLNKFRFSAKNSKNNSKFEKSFPLVCRARWDKSIRVQHERFKIKIKSRYLFEDRDTDRRMESISECTLKGLSNDTWQAYGNEENNIPPPLH